MQFNAIRSDPKMATNEGFGHEVTSQNLAFLQRVLHLQQTYRDETTIDTGEMDIETSFQVQGQQDEESQGESLGLGLETPESLAETASLAAGPDRESIGYDMESFIIEMECYPCLWNTSTRSHHDQNMRINAWELISKKFGKPGQ